MGSAAGTEIDAWLRDGGIVVTASDRAARAVAAAFHRRRRAEGLTAWPAPNIQPWHTFVRSTWEDLTRDQPDARLLLNPTQEEAVWGQIVGSQNHSAALLDGPRHRLAALAMEAHELLANYAPRYLRPATRTAWQQDAGAFSTWLAVFDETCQTGNLLSPARLPLELISLLQSEPGAAQRPPLLLAGFDRILPVQRAVLDAWGQWRQTTPGARLPSTSTSTKPRTPRPSLPLAASGAATSFPPTRTFCDCSLSLRTRPTRVAAKLSAPFSRLGPASASSPLFEFSLGVPLSQVALPKAAHLLLRWLTQAISEHEIDWLLSTGLVGNSAECAALQAAMREIRRRSNQQPQWTLRAFLAAIRQLDRIPGLISHTEHWVGRIAECQRLLAEQSRRPQSHLAWAELVPQLLETLKFAGASPLSSTEFQAFDRWHQAVETCGSLGFDGRRIAWPEFLSTLARALDATLFAPESSDAPIQIAGPAESAGLTADAIWFLGASEDKWPARGATHPLLPAAVQREEGMPHATPQFDWDLAESITNRLLVSSPGFHISFPRQSEATEGRPSRLVVQLAGSPQPLPAELIAPTLAPSRSRFPSKTSAEFPTHTPRFRAAPACSPPNRNARSRRLPPPGWARKPGIRRRLDSLPLSAENSFTPSFIPSGLAPRMASASIMNSTTSET